MRTDQHSPLNLVTEDYSYVGGFDNEGPAFGDERSRLRTLLAQATTTRYGDGGQCDHCGARIRYVAVLRHAPTGDHLAVGETCLGNRFSVATADFHRMRKAAELDRAAHKILTAWNEFMAEHPADWEGLHASENGFVRDVLRRGRQYGNLSDKQFDAIVAAVACDAAYTAEVASRPVEATTAVPEGKGIVVTGVVLSTKWQENDFGMSLKMLVKVTTAAGSYKVWGSVPSSISPEVGDTVTFTANLTRSNDDQGFGFFKRPRLASVTA